MRENIEFIFSTDRDIVDVTIVMNIWKRNHIKEQLESLLSQTVIPKEIWIIHYEKHVYLSDIIEEYRMYFPHISVFDCDKNLRYFGRFSLAINITTKYAWLIDDDIIPGSEWLERCVIKCQELNSIISCTGRIIPENNYEPEKGGKGDSKKYFVGDIEYLFRNYCEKDTIVDFACNSYFFQTKWLEAYWHIWPATFDTGEDIHLSATCRNILNVNTYVLKQTNKQETGNLKKAYGFDDTATWRYSNFLELRRNVLQYHILHKGWKPLEWRDKSY